MKKLFALIGSIPNPYVRVIIVACFIAINVLWTALWNSAERNAVIEHDGRVDAEDRANRCENESFERLKRYETLLLKVQAEQTTKIEKLDK